MARSIDFILSKFGLGGVRVIDYKTNSKNLEQRSVSYNLEQGNVPQSDKVSYLGTPVFGAIVLKYEPLNLQLELQTVLSEVSMTKNIVKTSMQGVDGTVKEYISDGDYEVTIRGAIVAEDNLFPEDDIKLLHQLCLVKDALIVESEFLQLFDIYNLVIESYSFPEEEGYLNMQFFELQCVSDKPIELIIEDETLN